jgi:hypothetical protein
MTIQPSDAQPPLVRTATGQRLHIPGCPHVGSALQPATAMGHHALAVCTRCRAELAGQGRTYYATLEDALRALGCNEGTHRLIRDALRVVPFDQVWLPHSESYVALGLDGPGIAWVGKGYAFVKATGAFVELPGYRASRGGGAPLDVRWGATCDRHFVARPITGACDLCDEGPVRSTTLHAYSR